MVVGEVLIHPDLAVPIIVKPDHSVTYSHGSAFEVAVLESLQGAVEHIQGFRVSELRGIS